MEYTELDHLQHNEPVVCCYVRAFDRTSGPIKIEPKKQAFTWVTDLALRSLYPKKLILTLEVHLNRKLISKSGQVEQASANRFHHTDPAKFSG